MPVILDGTAGITFPDNILQPAAVLLTGQVSFFAMNAAPIWNFLGKTISLTTTLGIYNISILLQTLYTAFLTLVALAWHLISTKSLESMIEFGWRGLLGPLAMGVFHIYMHSS
jgi:hypothetical protein